MLLSYSTGDVIEIAKYEVLKPNSLNVADEIS